MAKRTTKPAIVIPQSRAEVEELIRTTVANRQKLQMQTAEKNQAFEAACLPFIKPIDDLTKEIDEALTKIEMWATAHKTAEFKEARSIKIAGHRIGWTLTGFGTSPRKGLTWDAVLTALKSLVGLGKAEDADEITIATAEAADLLIRKKEECDKATMVTKRADPLVKAILEQVGVTIGQGESFFLEPDEDQIPTGNITTATAA